ncbi:MAG: tetratricopeptide repeat protein 38 family protein [Gammaproteobacteria bacterium]|nr:tetratricopeptide repeat protein 38 family protein [Gammaproteobacteria bacterium]
MQQDYLGNPVSPMRTTTLRAIDDFIEGFLAYETRTENILAAADADPECCLTNVYAGLLWMFLEAPEAGAHASAYLAAAERTASAASRREQLNTAMLRSWVAGDLSETLRLCEQISGEFPHDLVVVKTHQYFEFNRGNSPEMLRVALKVLARNAEIPYMHGMAAFAYEQCHLLDDAEAAARTALELRRREPWAQHALAHVMLTRGRIDEGARFLEGMTDTWTGLNSFMSTHIWWHLALFYLSQGRHARVLAIFDRHCWVVAKSYSQDQIGAVSLLARMELAGIDVGERWQDVADHLAARAHDTVLPFLTMQYLYGLSRAGRTEAGILLRAVRHAADSAAPWVREVWQDVALPACEGLHAYAQGHFDSAWRHLNLVMPRIIEAGGSHAQRDLFDQILLDAAIKSGRTAVAQQMLELRRVSDPDGVPLNSALSGVYARLGLPRLAEQARVRAAVTRSRHPE